MKKNDPAICILGIGFSFWALALLARGLLPESTDAKDVIGLAINALSALGTLAAVLVALWLGLEGQRRETRRHRQRGYIAASRMKARLGNLRGYVVTLGHAAIAPIDPVAKHSVLSSMLRNRPLTAMLDFSETEIESLLGLVPQEAMALATMIEGLKSFEDEVLMHNESGFEFYGEELQHVISESWRARLSSLRDELLSALDRIVHARP